MKLLYQEPPWHILEGICPLARQTSCHSLLHSITVIPSVCLLSAELPGAVWCLTHPQLYSGQCECPIGTQKKSA